MKSSTTHTVFQVRLPNDIFRGLEDYTQATGLKRNTAVTYLLTEWLLSRYRGAWAAGFYPAISPELCAAFDPDGTACAEPPPGTDKARERIKGRAHKSHYPDALAIDGAKKLVEKPFQGFM